MMALNSFDVSSLSGFNSDAIYNAAKNYKAGGVSEDYQKYGEVKGEAFSDIFSRIMDGIKTTNNYLSDAENEEIKWALGKTKSTHDLSIALQKAQMALQYTVAVRDRVVGAYREIMQMQI